MKIAGVGEFYEENSERRLQLLQSEEDYHANGMGGEWGEQRRLERQGRVVCCDTNACPKTTTMPGVFSFTPERYRLPQR